ncbi:DUF6344 domain-containing protein [Streptomyces antimicrobicus]|uniref:DUF6344 domain-containing protein n=1 Tax=Streptomyces antimicrobicus TaxID=2883108 RepID=A0ABS8BD91_9ACTN|nr:DUF6344 domain-containing protein [Streptomyces antimicrobicus]MCB5182561.1 DUF6344 domain-containing protein [Streptomyces antimicrobicus]
MNRSLRLLPSSLWAVLAGVFAVLLGRVRALGAQGFRRTVAGGTAATVAGGTTATAAAIAASAPGAGAGTGAAASAGTSSRRAAEAAGAPVRRSWRQMMRGGALPPTLAQRIRAEAHGSSPSVRRSTTAAATLADRDALALVA